jgi:hypothetical protein
MTSYSTMPDQPQSKPKLWCSFSTTGSTRLKLAFGIGPANSCKRCSKAELDESLARSRYARREKRSGGDSEGTASVSGHRHGHRSQMLDRGAARPAEHAGRQDERVEEPCAAGLSAPHAGGEPHCRSDAVCSRADFVAKVFLHS